MPRPDVTAHPALRAALALAFLSLGPAACAQAAEGSRLSGRVVDAATLAPIPNAEIELANMNAGQGFYRVKSDAKGAFAIERVAGDRYYGLTVTAAGYADFVLSGWQFPSAQRAAEVVIPLDRAGTLEVRALKADGRAPVPNARVAIRSERSQRWWEGFRPPPAPVFTDAAGLARFVDLQAGSWTVSVDAPGLLPSETRQVLVRRSETTAVPAKLVRAGSIAGTVRLRDGTPLPSITVTARGPGEGVGTSGPDGTFSIEGLAPGRYRLEVSPEGFDAWRSADTYRLEEGASRGDVDVTVTPKAPELALVLEREALLPGTDMTVEMRSFRVDTAGLALYAVPAPLLVDPARDFRRLAEGGPLEGLPLLKRWDHRPVEGAPFTWRNERVPLPDSLAPGAYLLQARAGALDRRAIFFVTDLGILVKRSPRRTLVWAATLRHGAPAGDVAVYVVPPASGPGVMTPGQGIPGFRPLPGNFRKGGSSQGWSGALRAIGGAPAARSDTRGVATLEGKGAPDQARIVAVSADHGIAVAESPLAQAAREGGDRVYLYTERPLYRPGHTVYWKLFARRGAETGYTLPATGTVAKIALTGPDGSSRSITSDTLSASGSADGSFVLPADAPLGDWRVAATVGAAVGGATFGVQEYRKPEFRVEVKPDRDVYLNGDEVRFVAAARYFFGAPVFGAAVRYNLFETRLSEPPGGDDEMDGQDETMTAGFGRVLQTGEARTDVDGNVALAFAPPRASFDRRLTLEVEVVDAGNRVASSRGSVIVGRGLFTLRVRPASGLVLAGRPIVVEVLTRDHLGKPVSAAVTVQLDQDVWSPLEHRYTRSTRPLASAEVTTDARGRALVPLVPSPVTGGSIQIRARGDDARGNRITGESSVWVYDARFTEYPYRYPSLEVFLDKERYAPGDTARVLVNSDSRNALVLATVEGRDLEDMRTIALPGNTGLIQIPIRKEYAPNVFLSIHVRRGREVQSRTLPVDVEAPRRDLIIKITPEKSEYRPREAATIALEAQDAQGRPARAELSVGVVDEAIYALRADDTPDAKDVFYGKRPNWVTTVVSFPVLYYGGVDKGREQEVRRDFRDVALWAPAVWTGADGKASVTVTWPDNLTTWRITSRGMTEATLVGQAVAKTVVSKPIVARAATPRAFVAGDEAEILSVVTNRTREPITAVAQAIEISGAARASGETRRATDLPAGGESRESWPVRIDRTLDRDSAVASVTFRATAKEDADAVLMESLVRPRAVPIRSRGARVVDTRAGEIEIALPRELVAPGSFVRIEASPSPAAMAVAGAEYLTACPVQGTEPTAGAVLAVTAVLEASRRAGADPPGWAGAPARLAALLERLASLQSPMGGWGFWSGQDPDPYLTALAVDALSRAERIGAATPRSTQALWQGVRWGAVQLAEMRSLDGEAYLAAHLAPAAALPAAAEGVPELRGQLNDVLVTLNASRERLGVAGLALSARAAVALGRAEDASRFTGLLKARARKSGGALGWPADPDADWFGEELENTALALSALVLVNERDSDAAAAVQWLAARRGGGYWRSTRVTASVVTALAEYLAAHAGEMRPEYRLRVRWNGEAVLERDVTPGDAFGGAAFRVRVPGRALRAGANRLTVEKEGRGTVYLSWEAEALVPSPGPATPSGPGALTLKREYFHAERTSDRRGRPRYLVTPAATGEPFRVGEQVLVRLTLTAPSRMRWIVLEDPRPSGFESGGALPPGADWPWDAHAEERDDRNVFLVGDLDEGETVIESLLRPEMAGTFTALPAAAWGFYEPETTARSDEAVVKVGAR